MQGLGSPSAGQPNLKGRPFKAPLNIFRFMFAGTQTAIKWKALNG